MKRLDTPMNAMALHVDGVLGAAGCSTGTGVGAGHVAAQMKTPISICRILRGPQERFYHDAGLDVEIREGGPDVDAARPKPLVRRSSG